MTKKAKEKLLAFLAVICLAVGIINHIPPIAFIGSVSLYVVLMSIVSPGTQKTGE